MRKLTLLITMLFLSLGMAWAQKLLVNCDYNSSTEGWGTTKFSNYAGAYAYATANAKKATIVIEKTNTLSGNTFDNNHKNYSNLAVVIKDGATMGNAASKWDMTYPVTVEPGGTLTCARPASASVSNIHIKNKLIVGAKGATKKAYVNFLSDSYQDCDISIRYNGSIEVYNADFYVQDLDAQGKLTIEDSKVEVDGAFASATFFATTLTNTEMVVNGNQISGGLSDFAGGTSNQLGNVKLNNSTLTIKEGDTKVAANVTATNSTINVDNLTVNSGKTLNLNEGSTLEAANITTAGTGSVKIDGVQAEISGGQAFIPVAKIGEKGYETLADALEATKTMTGDVTVEILDKVTFNQPLIGSYSSINFVGKAENAEMYLDVQGYITATGKKVSFTDLKLSKSKGGFITNAGFMNVAFGIYDVEEVTYTNCTFENGACASSGKVTFNGCTFYRSHDRYGLWAYGAPNVVVDGCTFADIRGIKLWDEGKQKLGALTVKNTDFSAVDDKPAIVLTSGKSVTLAGNTYNTAKGALELDLDGNPNGTPVTSDVTPVCVNDNGACGVLVDGKIYTTVAQAAEVATSGSNVKLLHNSVETVELAEGVVLDKNGFEAAGVTVYVKPPVAKIGDNAYASIAEALDAAQNANLTDVVITIVGENTAATADKFNLYQKSIFDKVTFKQENGNKPYYFEELYTGSRTNNGKFVFDGVNIAVTANGQYILEGNVVLSNNSYIKSNAEANCFVYNAEVTVETGSKIYGVIEDIRGGSLIIDGGKTDGTYCEEPALSDAILNVNWATSNLVLKNGAYVKVNAANEVGRLTVNGKVDVSNSKLESYQYIAVNQGATFTLNAGSVITTKELTGVGVINVDAEGMNAGDVVNLNADLSKFTGTFTVLNNDKLEVKIVDGKIVLAAKPVAKIGEQGYATLEAAFAAATEEQTITLLSDATPALTSQRAITKAAVIDLGGKTMTLTEDDLYFGTTTFKNGTIVVDPSVKASTAVFWMFANQTLTFDNVKIVATGVTGTYLIGLDGNNSDLNLLNGSKIIIDNAENKDFIVIAHNGNGNIKVENSTIDVKNVGRGFLNGNVTISDSQVNLAGISKAGFRINAGQTLAINGNSTVTVEGALRDGGIHLTDLTATYTKAETATVNATLNEVTPVAVIGAQKFATLQAAIDAVQNGETIILQKDCAEAVTFTQTKEVSFVLDGNNKTYTGSINITARAGKDAPSTLVIKNFNFKTDAIAHDFIKSVETNYYPNNITISNCKFEGTADINTENYAVVAVRLKSANNIKIENCTGSGLHSFLQNTAGWNMQIDNVDVTNSLSGFAMGTVQGAGIKNCDLTVNKSGIRFDAQLNNNAVITDNKINAFIPVVVRKASVESNITVEGTNTFEATNTDGLWMAVGTSEYEANGELPTAATGQVKVVLTDTGLDAAGIYGSYYDALTIHVGAAQNSRMVTRDIYVATMDEAVAEAKAISAGAVIYKVYGEVELTTGGSHGILDLGKNVVIEGADATAKLTIVGGGVPDIKGVTFKNITLADEGTYLPTANEFMYQNYIDCTFENVTFVDGIRLSGTSSIKDSKVDANTTNEYAIWLDEGEFTMTGTTVVGGADAYGLVKSDKVSKITITGNTFQYLGEANKEALNVKEAVVIAENNQFIDCVKGILPADKTNYTDESKTTVATDAAIAGNNTVTVNYAAIGEQKFETLLEAINAVQQGETITLLRDVTMDYNARDAYETQAQNVVIDGNGKVLTLNQKNSDWASFGLAGNSKLVLNNMTIEKTGYGDTSGAWNTHAIIFSCPVEMTDVTVNNSVAVQAGAALTNVNINEANGYYGLWINGNGQAVTVNGGAINATNGGRGIKIADQYIDAPAQVTLNVTGTVFSTAKKAAVLVSSTAGAKIAADNVDIANVAEDNVNLVWVDEDWAQHFGNIEVTGATVAQEGIENFVAQLSNGASYKTLAAAINAAKAGETITLLQDINEGSVTITKSLTIDGAGKTFTGHIHANLSNVKMTVKNVNFNGDNATYDYAIRVDKANSFVVENCTADNYKYSFLYANKSNNNLTVKNVTVTNCANYGVYFASFNNATVENLTVIGAEYGVVAGNAANSKVNIKNCTFDVADVPLNIQEKGTGKVTFTFQGVNEMSKAEFYTSQYVKVVAAAQVGTKVCGSLQDAVVAANNGETVKVLADVNMTTANFVTQVDGYATLVNVAGKAVTIDLNGKKVTVNAANADLNGKANGNMLMSVFHADPNGTLTLTDSSAEGTGTVELFANDATVYALIVSENANDKSNPGKIIVNGGNYIADRLSDSMIFADINEVITVNGGNFHLDNVGEGPKGNGSPWIFNASGQNQIHINVNGGTYNANIAKQFYSYEVNLGEGLTTTNNGDGTWTVVPAVATVGEESFGSIQEAIDAAQDGETVKLIADVALDTKKYTTQVDNLVVLFNVKGKAVTFDLNGKKIDVNASAANLGGKMLAGVFSADVEGDFTITDSSAEGTGAVTVTVNDAKVYSVFISENAGDKTKSGKMTVEAGNFTTVGKVANAMIFADTDKVVTINGGTFICDGVSASENYPWLINTHGNNEKQVTVNGGTFNIDINHQYRPFEVFVPENLAVKANGNGTWKIVPAQAYVTELLRDYVNESGSREHKVGYATVAEAIAATNELGNTVTILAGEYTGNLNVNKGITVQGAVDAEGNNLVTFNGKLNITADGANVKNININNPAGSAAYVGAKDVVVDGCQVVGNNGFRSCYTSGTVTFKNSVITGAVYGIHFDGNAGGNIVIENCTITGWTSFAKTIENVAISGTTFAEGNYNKLRLYQNATITDCTFNEKMTVDFGTNNTTAAFNNCTVENGKALTDVIYIADIAEMGIVVTVDGVPVSVVAKVGEQYYLSLQAAIDAATEGQTVTIISNIALTEGVTVAADDNIFIDLNGKTITGTPAEAKAFATITNRGTLTIQGNGAVVTDHQLAGSTGYAVNTITNCGTLTIDGATIENKSTASNQIGYAIDNNSTTADAEVTVVSGTVTVSGSNYYDGIRQFCNSTTAKNDVIVSGGEVSSIWMQNPSDGADKNTKDVKGRVTIEGGNVGALYLEPSANFEAAVTGGHVGEVSYFQTAEGRDLKEFVTGGTFGTLISENFLAWGYQLTGDTAPYTVEPTGRREVVTFVDGEFTEYTNKNDIEVGTLTYKRGFSKYWTPLYVPFEIPVSQLAEQGFEVAFINGVRRNDTDYDGELDKFEMEIIYIHGGDNCDGSGKTLKANYPYFVRSKDVTTTLEVVLTDATLYASKENAFDCTTFTEKFVITGNNNAMNPADFAENDYTVAVKDGQSGWSNSATGALKPFRFYMTVTDRAENLPVVYIKSMSIVVRGEELPDGTTVIYDVLADRDIDGTIYDLQGRKVVEITEPGIYIINGKKVLIK